ncbi:hypothetical protein PAXRUDRAFT_11455 [Paxillus rubicundulus Ve08.2h10]|uniref:F-box domain-containing protein n=1 Tax=Paxillus rubicundulus Ve08.2h10 TaxID=930991 RepID=A0A0D0DDM8_9AGAM|nr:hypothetical protein PAXRUDRAFT_11455 [Paxillus rubicundulus Ve08.2h10]
MRFNLVKSWRFVRRKFRPGTSGLDDSGPVAVCPPAVCPQLGTSKKQPIDLLEALPPELVGYIFRLRILDSIHCRDTKYSYSQLPVLLCLVSKSWRNFVYSSPLLWAYVLVRTSEGAAPALHALQKRLGRSQNASLFLDIMVGIYPDRDALRVIFAESSRFRYLNLTALNLSWCNIIPTQAFTQLKKLTVHMGRDNLIKMDELNAIFSSVSHLCSVNFSCVGDPGPIKVNGHHIHSLFLDFLHVPVTRVLEFFAACPNLRDGIIMLSGDCDSTPMPPKERILLPQLRSLSLLYGTGNLTLSLRSVRAPLLTALQIDWGNYDVGECDFEAVKSFLACCPHLKNRRPVNVCVEGATWLVYDTGGRWP